MFALFALGTCAFVLCFILTPLIRNLSIRLGLVDQPDTERKLHLRAVPRIGGLPIAIAYAGSLSMALYLNADVSKIYVQHTQLFRELLPAALIIFLTGLIDDIWGLKPSQKLLGQCVAAVLAVSFGARLSFMHLPPWMCFALSLIWLIGCTNAFNLIDGMDGLATGISLIAVISTLVVALVSHNPGLALAAIPLAGALLAFLLYNFNPASVFLGDCGSLTIGFVLGCISLIWSQHATSLVGMAAPLMVLALPLIDVCLAIGRRFLRNVPLFQGDRGHIHHMVLGLGFSTRGAALVLYAAATIAATLSVFAYFDHIGLVWPILILFVFLVMIGIDRLGYVEWYAARRSLARFSVRQAVQDEIYLMELRRSLLYANTVEECWAIVRRICQDLKFASARLDLLGQTYSERFGSMQETAGFRIQLHLGAQDYLLLTRETEQSAPRLMMPVLDSLQAAVAEIAPKLEEKQLGLRRHAA
jgi:UDP-GlcNAc:undecaprenyl-phosphate GlcNAc-1-phosphate transferase